MKKASLLSEEKRGRILSELEKNPKKFVELKKTLQVESNLLAYNLNMLVEDGLYEP